MNISSRYSKYYLGYQLVKSFFEVFIKKLSPASIGFPGTEIFEILYFP